jgi:hypothetical protein
MPGKKKRQSLIKQLDDSELFNETDFRKDAHIDIEDFNEEAVRHPELHYHYGKLHSFGKKTNAMAELKVHLAKLDMQTALAAAHERIRKERTEAGEKCTEALLDNESRLSPEYTEALATFTEAKQSQIETEFEASLMEIGERVFSKRTEILKTVGHLLSRELDTGVSIHKSSAREASADFSARLRADVEAAKEIVRKNRENKQ